MAMSEHPHVESHVVTVGMDFADGKAPWRMIYEVFRGDHRECLNVTAHMPEVSHDQRTIQFSWVGYSTIDAWEDFLKCH